MLQSGFALIPVSEADGTIYDGYDDFGQSTFVVDRNLDNFLILQLRPAIVNNLDGVRSRFDFFELRSSIPLQEEFAELIGGCHMPSSAKFLVTNVFTCLLALQTIALPGAAHSWSLAIDRVETDVSLWPVAVTDCHAADLFQEGRIITDAGRLEEGGEATRRALTCAEDSFGPDHLNTAFILNDLAKQHLALQQLERALSFSRRAVEIMAAARPQSLDYAKLAMTLASIQGRLGRHRDAEPIRREAYDIIHAVSPDDLRLKAAAARNLGMTLAELSRYAASRNLLGEVARLVETSESRISAAYGQALLDLASAHLMLDELDKAEQLAMQAALLIGTDRRADLILARATIRRSALGKAEAILRDILEDQTVDGIIRAQAFFNVAFIQIQRGRFVEAEETLQNTISAYHAVVGEKHPAIARSLHSLAIVYHRLRDDDRAEILYRQAIQMFEETSGPTSIAVADTRKEYAHLLMERGDLEAAEEEARAALAIYANDEDAPIHSLDLAYSSLGFVLKAKGDNGGAAAAFEEGLGLIETACGPMASDLPPGLIELGSIRIVENRLEEAEAVLVRAAAIRERDTASTLWRLAKALSGLASLHDSQGRPRDALAEIERAVGIIQARLVLPKPAHTDLHQGEALSERHVFELYLKMSHRLMTEEHDDLAPRMFEIAQLPNLTKTASAVARLSLRLAEGGDDLGRLLRRRQSAIEDWQAINAQLSDLLATAKTSQRETHLRRGRQLRDRRQSLEQRIATLDDQLEDAFPDHATLTSPKAVKANDVQALLGPKDAVFMQVTGESSTYVLLLTHDRLKAAETDLGKKELARRVQSLRYRVDLSEAGMSGLQDFDVESAHRLYQALFAPFEDSLAEIGHLMAVFDRDMEQLPASLLLRTAVPKEDYGLFRNEPSEQAFDVFQGLDYLIRHFTVSTLPSIGALKVLRQRFQAPTQQRPFAAFGNPIFEGKDEQMGLVDGIRLPKSAMLEFRRMASKRFGPLPDSETELMELADALNADRTDILLRERASETILRKANLEAYQTIAFGTHLVVPGKGDAEVSEPGLILPVADGDQSNHDGILTESEVIHLRINADLILLSACHRSVPPERPGAEALLELARAFLIAGADSLLVSHWGGDRSAMQALTMSKMEALQYRRDDGLAATLQQSMTSMIEQPPALGYSHPAYWATFAILGEGLM